MKHAQTVNTTAGKPEATEPTGVTSPTAAEGPTGVAFVLGTSAL